ncbi:TonB-dependent receptor [Desulfobacterales bacterium HSG2]|nr:TonB-dependent receptor [Desulfobacterales bacterium HSG2]
MRKCFCWLSLFVIILSATLSQAAGPDQDVEAAIDEEFKWLREEAEAQFVTVATKTKMTAQEAPSIVSVITAEEIRNMGARNIVDVLRTVPGFDLVKRGNDVLQQIYIRGLTSPGNEKVKIMINGHSMQMLLGSPGQNFERLPTGSIRKIEIIRGPGSALYGTGAFLGVINIITKEGGDEPSRVSFEGGSFDTAKPSAELSLKNGGLKTYMYAEHYRTDGYDGIIESDKAALLPIFAPSASREMTDGAEYCTFQTNISYDSLYFSVFFQKASSEIPVGSVSVLTDEDDFDTLYTFAELGYRLPAGDRGNLQMRAYYDYGDFKPMFEGFPEETAEMYIGFPDGEGLHGGPRAKLSVAGAEITADYEPYPGVGLVVGTSYEDVRQYDVKHYANHNSTGKPLDVGGVTYPSFPFQYFPSGLTDISENGNWNRNAERGVAAVYAQGIFDLKKIFSLERSAKNLALTIGARYDSYDDVGSSANPRLGIVWAPTEKLWIKMLYGEAFRAPGFGELYAQNSPIRGNPDLNPEEITTAEGLLGYHFTRTVSGSLTGFYVNAENLIRLSENVFENVGKTESCGMEAELKAAFGRNRYAYLNLTWQDVRDTTHSAILSEGGQTYVHDDFHPGTAPEFYGNIGVNYGFTERILGNISLNYVGERERTEEKMWLGETLVRKDQRDPVKERWLLSASLTLRDFFAKGTELQISGFNLLDEDHRDPEQDGYILNDIPCPGRSFTGRISYSF